MLPRPPQIKARPPRRGRQSRGEIQATGGLLRVCVRYFAALRERRGREQEWVEVYSGETLGQLYARLFPQESAALLPVAFARNLQYTHRDDIPEEGDEVTFLPPIGGG